MRTQCANNRPRWRTLVLPLLITLLLCTGCEGGQKSVQKTRAQGAKNMITYPIGRFAVDIPAEMTLDHQGQTIRYTDIEEVAWPAGVPHEKAREAEWDRRLSRIRNLTPPRGKNQVILETRDIPALGKRAKAVLYYSSDVSSRTGDWELLVDTGTSGVWFRYNGVLTAKEEMLAWVIGVANAYQSRRFGDLIPTPGNWFYTRTGAVNLPFLEDESAYARFEGHPLGLKIQIEMNEIHIDELPKEGLLARTAAAIATGYAVGVDVDRIRSQKRTVAGLEGEEEVDRMTDQYRTALSFAWRFAGKKNSGELPEILIHMESADGKLEEKLKIWDFVLDSMKPLYK